MKLDQKLILISGGAGFIGSHLVDALKGRRARVLDDFSTGRQENLKQHDGSSNVDIVKGEVRDQALLDRVMEGVQVVFHLACRNVRRSISHPWESHDVNAGGTLALLKAARSAGVDRFVHVSSSEVYGTAQRVPMDEDHPCRPHTMYGAAKLAGEAYARAFHRCYGLPVCIVRPFNNYGPRSHCESDAGEVIPRFAAWALNGRAPVIFGDGSQTRDFIHVEETAHWLVRCAGCDELVGQTINLGSGVETSVLDVAEIVYAAAGAKGVEPQFEPGRPGDLDRHLADTTLAKRLLAPNGFSDETVNFGRFRPGTAREGELPAEP